MVGKKAVVVLHGIMGSQLFAADDIMDKNGKVEFEKNQRLWIYSPLMDGCFSVKWDLLKSPLPSVDNYFDEDDKIEALACDEYGNSVNPITTAGIDDRQYGDKGVDGQYGAANAYTDIVVRLKHSYGDENAKFFTYDWRKGAEQSAHDLRNDLDRAAEEYSEVYIVAHSMGGLVALEYARTCERPEKLRLITLGTPFFGAPKAIHVLETGKALPLNYGMEGLRRVVKNIRACYDLLPTEEYYKRSLNSAVLETPQFNSNAFLTAQAESFHRNLDCVNTFNEMAYSCAVAGYGEHTMTGVSFPLHSHENYSNQGDGTVPLLSATMGGAIKDDKLVFVKEDHGRLVSNEHVLAFIDKKINAW